MRRQNILVVFLFFISLLSLFALDVPPLRGRVNDYADIISPSTERLLNEKLKKLEESDSTQVVILTVPSLKGDSMEDFSIRVVEKWKIGQKGLDNGVLLLVSKNDRKVRIEVGYGLEGRLTDLLAGRIIDYEIIPAFKSGNFDEGFVRGVDAIVKAVKGEYKAPANAKKSEEGEGAKYFPFFVLILIIVMIGSKRRILGGLVGAIFFPLLALFLFPIGRVIFILALLPLGFFGGWLLPLFFISGMGRRGGGMFFGGGGFGSGDSDSFFDGGGFSGGGGGFGGGGASGSW